MKKSKIILLSIIIFLIVLSGSIFYLYKYRDQAPNNTEKNEVINDSVKDFIKDKNKEQLEDDAKVYDTLISMLNDMLDAYDEALGELENEETKETRQMYSNARTMLGKATVYMDGHIKNFPNKTFMDINDMIVQIDNLMESKAPADQINPLIERIKTELDSIKS